MMLSRTADSLFWIARYMERAENLARTLRVTDRLSLMPSSADADGNEWHSTVVVSGCEQGFYEKHEEATPENVSSGPRMTLGRPPSVIAAAMQKPIRQPSEAEASEILIETQ